MERMSVSGHHKATGRQQPGSADRGQRRLTVLFDGSKLVDRRSDGIRRYVSELLLALDRQHRPQSRWRIEVTPDGYQSVSLREIAAHLQQGTLPREFRERKPANASLWTRVIRFAGRLQRSVLKRLPWRRAKVCDLLHLPMPNSAGNYRHIHAPWLVTVHDLSHVVCPQFHTRHNRDTLQRGLELSEVRQAEYVSVSESTAREMQAHLDISSERISVVLEACDRERFHVVQDRARLDAVKAKYNLPAQPFLLSLSTLEPRKNLLAVVEACRRAFEAAGAEFHLVIAGRFGWGDHEPLRQAAAGGRVHLIGAVEDEDLAALYTAATGFICMSHYEGFCLPLLEAMSCGCPVIYAHRSAMPEVVGGAGLNASPDDVDSIARQVIKLMSSERLRRELSLHGLSRASEFDWDKAARQVLGIYERMLGIAEQRIEMRASRARERAA